MRFFPLVILLFLFTGLVYGQEQSGRYRAMFYNVENMFDTIDNPDKNDEEFLPEGDKHWDNYRYWKKINHTFKVIAAAGISQPPDIIGLCEVESFLPLYNLCYNTPLVKYPYAIIHQNSPDKRGICTALLVRKDRVKVLSKSFIQVVFPWDSIATTREILAAELLIQEDTLFVFVNHWPSRRGGQSASEPRRLIAAEQVWRAIDSIRFFKPNAKILVMGDFNDEPHNKSVTELSDQADLINLSKPLEEKCNCGTYRYKSHWNMLDQVLVSESLKSNSKLQLADDALRVFDKGFLLTEDKNFGGFKPRRTYLGPRYIGGYSDHLPVTLDLIYPPD